MMATFFVDSDGWRGLLLLLCYSRVIDYLHFDWKIEGNKGAHDAELEPFILRRLAICTGPIQTQLLQHLELATIEANILTLRLFFIRAGMRKKVNFVLDNSL